MKPMRSIAFALLAVAAAAFSVVSAAWGRTVDKVSAGVQRLKVWAFETVGLKAASAEPAADDKPMVAWVRQVAYRLRACPSV